MITELVAIETLVIEVAWNSGNIVNPLKIKFNLFDIVDRAYVLGEQSIIAQGTPKEILKSSKAIELYFGTKYNNWT